MRKDSKDMTGQVFGKLTAKEGISIKGERGLRWKCQCACGKEKIVHGGHLRAGYVKSCGCISLDNIEESAKRGLYSRYVAKSRYRKIDFKLNRLEFDGLVTSDCVYCRNPPSQILRNSTNIEVGSYTGIDRKDNTLGYTKENSVPCCKICNVMKQSLSVEEWFNHMKKVLQL